jgi:hypothetical protein
MPFDQGHVSKVRSVHDQVSRERLREEHSGSFRRVIAPKTPSKAPSNCVPKGLQKRHPTPTYPIENKSAPDPTRALLTEGL